MYNIQCTHLHSRDFQIAFDEKGYNVVQCIQNISTRSFEKSTLKNDFYNFYFFFVYFILQCTE